MGDQGLRLINLREAADEQRKNARALKFNMMQS